MNFLKDPQRLQSFKTMRDGVLSDRHYEIVRARQQEQERKINLSMPVDVTHHPVKTIAWVQSLRRKREKLINDFFTVEICHE